MTKLTFRHGLAATAVVALLPSGAHAQTRRTTAQLLGACHVAATAPWIKQQAAWFDEPKHDWSDDTLRTALLRATGLSAPFGAPPQLGYIIVDQPPASSAEAAAMTQSLLKLAAARGSTWPTKSVVGPAATHAVFILAQRDTALGRAALHRMMEAGPQESAAADVATLEDFMRLKWGRKQIYGTQFTSEGGTLRLAPMEDSTHADLRREDAALPPLKTGICLANAGK